jgi:hypothetical protein
VVRIGIFPERHVGAIAKDTWSPEYIEQTCSRTPVRYNIYRVDATDTVDSALWLTAEDVLICRRRRASVEIINKDSAGGKVPLVCGKGSQFGRFSGRPVLHRRAKIVDVGDMGHAAEWSNSPLTRSRPILARPCADLRLSRRVNQTTDLRRQNLPQRRQLLTSRACARYRNS